MTSTSSPRIVRAVVLTEVLPPPCRTSEASLPIRRAVYVRSASGSETLGASERTKAAAASASYRLCMTRRTVARGVARLARGEGAAGAMTTGRGGSGGAGEGERGRAGARERVRAGERPLARPRGAVDSAGGES